MLEAIRAGIVLLFTSRSYMGDSMISSGGPFDHRVAALGYNAPAELFPVVLGVQTSTFLLQKLGDVPELKGKVCKLTYLHIHFSEGRRLSVLAGRS